MARATETRTAGATRLSRIALNLVVLAALASPAAAGGEPAVPFPAALAAAAIRQDRLDSIMDRSLILGNGDVNALLYSQGSRLLLRLTKNDVWDARIDTSNDPPLLKIDVKTGKMTGPLHGPMPSWNKPYPCPRVCGVVSLGPAGGPQTWDCIRAEGRKNSWQYKDGTAVMGIQGRAGASCGWACGPVSVSTDKYPALRLKLSGTANAKFYVDLGTAGGAYFFGSTWIPTPTKPGEHTLKLPPGKQVGRVILYTWTVDGKPAENRFAAVTFEGPGGKVPVDLRGATSSGTGPAELDIARAVAHVQGRPDGAPRAQVRALAQRNVFLIDSPAEADLSAVAASYLPAAKTGRDKDVQWLTQLLPGDVDWPGMTFAVALARRGRQKAVAIVTSLEVKDPLAEAVSRARSAASAEADKLIAEHERAWRTFWSASGVDLADETLRAMWYRNLYFLRCVAAPGAKAVGLYAGLTNNAPPWHGSHTLNYNSEQTFWTAFPTNHVELAEPYVRMISRYLPRARWFAKETYNCGGACIPHNVFTHEIPDPTTCRGKNHRMHAFPPYAYTIGVSGFAVQNLWWAYKYQPDRAYLETTAYPAVRDVAVFYADFMDQCKTDAGGKVVLAPSYSPEHWSLTPDFARNRNGTFDIAFARFVFRAAIEGAAALGRDKALTKRFATELTRLPAYPLGPGPEPILVDVQDAPPITYNIAVPVVPVFPGDQVTWLSPEPVRKLFARTVERVRWNGYNSSMILSVARARLSLPDTWTWQKREFLARSRPNGTITLRAGDRCGHFTEQFAATMAISELLIQSVGDVIRIFPAWPVKMNARFHTLRTQGGFLVSGECKDERIGPVTILATVGGPLRILSPWPGRKAVWQDGKTHTPAPADARGIILLATRPGQKLVLAPAP